MKREPKSTGRSLEPTRSRRLILIPLALAGLLMLGGAVLWAAPPRRQAPKFYDAQVVATLPHATDAFCQGLEFADGELFEGTGLHGQSKLRKVDLATARVLQEVSLDPTYFGEGITVFGDKIYQLTWQSRLGFIYDKATFKQLGTFRYTGEGWGLTHDAKHLIMSDGTATLRFLDPKTFKIVRRVRVTDRGQPIPQLNELEYINGEIFANIWNSTYIVRINPANGAVTGWVDLRGLSPRESSGTNAVLNGIAHDPKTDKLYVTGKNWSDMFEIKLLPRK